MHLNDAKVRFIHTWAILATQWGINRTMGQIHALLLTSPLPLSTDQTMERLQISRGNANMNIRALIDWGLIYKELRPGIRREYFQAEKDMWAVTKKIIRERKKREIDPLVEMLDEMKDVEVETGTSPDDLQNFKKIVKDLMEINRRTDLLYNLFQTIDQTGLFSISDEIVNIKGKK